MDQPYRQPAVVEKDEEEETVEKEEPLPPLPSIWPWVALGLFTAEMGVHYFFSNAWGSVNVLVGIVLLDSLLYCVFRGFRVSVERDDIIAKRDKAALARANYNEEKAKQETRTRAICRGFVKAVKHPYVDIDAALITGNEERAAEDVKVLSVFVRAEVGAT